MSRICPICTKGSQVAGNYSDRVRATKFNPTGKTRKFPNLQWAKLTNGSRLKICTGCLRNNLHLRVAKKVRHN